MDWKAAADEREADRELDREVRRELERREKHIRKSELSALYTHPRTWAERLIQAVESAQYFDADSVVNVAGIVRETADPQDVRTYVCDLLDVAQTGQVDELESEIRSLSDDDRHELSEGIRAVMLMLHEPWLKPGSDTTDIEANNCCEPKGTKGAEAPFGSGKIDGRTYGPWSKTKAAAYANIEDTNESRAIDGLVEKGLLRIEQVSARTWLFDAEQLDRLKNNPDVTRPDNTL